jgi:hypothetical protein
VEASSYTDYHFIAGSSVTANVFATVGGLAPNTSFNFRVWPINTGGITNYAFATLGST